MALPPDGPKGDYVSQAEYAAQVVQERQSAQQQPSQSQEPERKEESPKLSAEELKTAAWERNLAENDRYAKKESDERFERSGPNPELSDKALAANEIKLQQALDDHKLNQGQDQTKARENSKENEIEHSL